jgi:protein O-GlcNAc transferase
VTRPVRSGQPLLAQAQRVTALAAAQAGRFEEARSAFERSLELDPNNATAWVNLGAVHQALREFEPALQRYAQALRLNPGSPEAWNNRALVLAELGRCEEAVSSCDLAVSLRPEYGEAHNTRGLALQGLHRWPEALASHDEALRRKPGYAKAHHNRGIVLLELGRPADALASLERALQLSPAIEGLHGLVLNTRMKLARWEGHAQRLADLRSRVEQGQLATQPFALLSLIDSADLQLRAARAWAARHYPTLPGEGVRPRARVPGEPLRIGYFSADFHHHATSHLMAGLFEVHDRQGFRITAFSFGPDDDDPMTRRVRSAFDEFVDVRGLSDVEVARQARDRGIDIAVDLKGYTRDCRPGIFAARAAPIQVSYLGYPGTMGAPFIDYVIADGTLIPLSLRNAYDEQPVLLPGSYQVNDRTRLVAPGLPPREALGLPEAATVFACFNHTYKINPEVFGSWMRILSACRDGVLWLLEDSPEASGNLRLEAQRRGVDPARIVFAPRAPTAEHLARHAHADLFLDTWPYNAHTTASDALWMGVPVVTKIGEGFASRVAASLLHAVALPELITQRAADYEALALELGRDPPRRQALRERLLANRPTSPLFNTEATARHVERAYLEMVQRQAAGLSPGPIDLRGG